MTTRRHAWVSLKKRIEKIAVFFLHIEKGHLEACGWKRCPQISCVSRQGTYSSHSAPTARHRSRDNRDRVSTGKKFRLPLPSRFQDDTVSSKFALGKSCFIQTRQWFRSWGTSHFMLAVACSYKPTGLQLQPTPRSVWSISRSMSLPTETSELPRLNQPAAMILWQQNGNAVHAFETLNTMPYAIAKEAARPAMMYLADIAETT